MRLPSSRAIVSAVLGHDRNLRNSDHRANAHQSKAVKMLALRNKNRLARKFALAGPSRGGLICVAANRSKDDQIRACQGPSNGDQSRASTCRDKTVPMLVRQGNAGRNLLVPQHRKMSDRPSLRRLIRRHNSRTSGRAGPAAAGGDSDQFQLKPMFA
jgi:hypothetical protein